MYYITFNNDREYTLKESAICIVSEYSNIDFSNYEVINKSESNNIKIEDINYIFSWDNKIGIVKKDFTAIIENKNNIIFSELNQNNKGIDLLNYLKEVESYIFENNGDNDESFLLKYLNKINVLNKSSFLYKFLSSNSIDKIEYNHPIILPFGFNKSQSLAIKNALTHNLSVIYGPPGTGKTQTILNIIANLIYSNQNVAVVSNNNSAIKNVEEKINNLNVTNISALLGKKENINTFFSKYKNNNNVKANTNSDAINNIPVEKLNNIINKISDYQKITGELKIEEKEQYEIFSNFDNDNILFFKKYFSKRKYIDSKWVLNFLYCCNTIFNNNYNDSKLSLWEIIKSFFKILKLLKFNLSMYLKIKKNIASIIEYIKYKYYSIAINELIKKQQEIEKELISYIPKTLALKFNNNIEEIKSFITNIFLQKFKNYIENKYKNLDCECDENNYKSKFNNFIERFPIIFSTTHSLMYCTGGYLFDYVIFDEASQINLTSAIVTLACAKNVVIVGDLKQIEHVVEYKHKKKINELFSKYNLPKYYDYNSNSLLNCVNKKYGDNLVSQLLNEHYRCPPSIIGFSNVKFYNNELIIHTNDCSDTGLNIHLNKGYYEYNNQNKLQAEIIKKIVCRNKINDFVVITQYKNQVNTIKKELNYICDNVNTVHKFQGRENDIVFFSTVKDNINMTNEDYMRSDFLNNANLMNVAFSRTKKQLHVLASKELLRKGNLINDFIRYAYHYYPESISIYEFKNNNPSILEILNENYDQFLKIKGFVENSKNMKHDTEILAKKWIQETIDEHFKNECSLSHDVCLYNIVNIKKYENDIDDKKFIMNNWTRCDFVIYSNIDKKVELVIEIDGKYHLNPIQKNRDLRKDRILNESKIKVYRITVIEGEKYVKKIIYNAINDVLHNNK